MLFAPQLAFATDQARQQTAVCTRRAGKTHGCAAKLLDVARRKPGCVALYLTLSRLNAKRIVWETLKRLNRAYGLNGTVLEAELCIRLPNGSRVFLSGAADEGEIEKFRGLPLGVVVIDEAQSFPGYIKTLVDDVLAPALMDFAGQLVLIGTPGAVPTGYFHFCAHSQDWAHHGWSARDNPFIERTSGKSFDELLADELKRRGTTEDDPAIQREWFGRWVLDPNSLVFRFSGEKNGLEQIPDTAEHIIGVDMGYDDSDAIAVLGWNRTSNALYLVDEWIGAHQDVTSLAKEIRWRYDKYSPLAIVADTGGLGKKIADEITKRETLPIEAADKQRKAEHIELLNDAMRSGRFFAHKSSRFAQDCMLLEWDRSSPEKPKIKDSFHSDICDAVLYAYRRSLHWLSEPPPTANPKPGSDEWRQRRETEQRRWAEAQYETDLARADERRAERDQDFIERYTWGEL